MLRHVQCSSSRCQCGGAPAPGAVDETYWRYTPPFSAGVTLRCEIVLRIGRSLLYLVQVVLVSSFPSLSHRYFSFPWLSLHAGKERLLSYNIIYEQAQFCAEKQSLLPSFCCFVMRGLPRVLV